MDSILLIARRLVAAGISCLPIIPDGSKSPALDEWKDLERRVPTEKELASWFRPGLNRGLAVIGGAVSGNMGVLDIEFTEYWELFVGLLNDEAPGLIDRLPIIQTPGKRTPGRHAYFRAECKVKTQKLAKLPPAIAAEWMENAKRDTAIEIKAEGGYVLTVGCPPACHPSGREYTHVSGPAIEYVPTLTAEEATKIITCAKALDWRAEQTKDYAGRQYRGTDDSPGTEWNKRGKSIADQLLEAEWVLVRSIGETQYWRRPGKNDGLSATLGHCRSAEGDPLLYVFTTSSEFQARKSYDSFGVYAALNHNGDFGVAAKSLRALGYGRADQPGAASIGNLIGVEAIAPIASDKPPGFPLIAFPDAIAEYARTVAESLSCPVDFPATAIIVAVSTAIGNTRSLKVKESWSEAARIYLACIAEPGSAKTPAQNQVMRPLLGLQAQWNAEYLRAKRNYEKDDSDAAIKPTYRHLLTTDATVEALAKILALNSRGVVYYADEITGWARSMGQYKAGKGSDRQFWLKAWSGEQHSVDRVKDGDSGPIFINSPFVNVLGGIQPDMLGELSDAYGRQDGFIHRLLFSFPEASPMAAWTDTVPDAGAALVWSMAIERLIGLKQVREANQNGESTYRPLPIEMAPSGKEMFVTWYNRHIAQTWEDTFPPHLLGPWSKFRSYAIRLILVAHLMRWGVLDYQEFGKDLVEDETVARGLVMTEYFKDHARRVYPSLSCSAKDKQLDKAFVWIRQHQGECTLKDLVRGHLAKNGQAALDLVNELKRAGYGTVEISKSSNGKDKVKFKLASFEDFSD